MGDRWLPTAAHSAPPQSIVMKVKACVYHAPTDSAKRGSVRRNSVQFGSERTSESCPPCAIAHSRAMLKPRPWPGAR